MSVKTLLFKGAEQPVKGIALICLTLLHASFMIGLGSCGMLGHMLLTQAFRHVAPAMLAPFSYGQILFAGMYGYLIFGHAPDMFGVIGIAVICLSGLAVAWAQRRG